MELRISQGMWSPGFGWRQKLEFFYKHDTTDFHCHWIFPCCMLGTKQMKSSLCWEWCEFLSGNSQISCCHWIDSFSATSNHGAKMFSIFSFAVMFVLFLAFINIKCNINSLLLQDAWNWIYCSNINTIINFLLETLQPKSKLLLHFLLAMIPPVYLRLILKFWCFLFI